MLYNWVKKELVTWSSITLIIILLFPYIARTLVPHLICDTYNPQNTENDFDPHQRSPTMLPDPDNLSDVYMPSRHYSQNVRFCEGTAMWKWNKCPKKWLSVQFSYIFYNIWESLFEYVIEY